MGWSHRIKAWLAAYLVNADPLAGVANTGAFIIWSHQPIYPLYVLWLTGDAWPALMTWFSTPFFIAVPLLARWSPASGRALFALAGIGNTLVSVKSFGADAGIAWFLLPCLGIALGLFRAGEWPMSVALTLLTGGAFWLSGQTGAPLHRYTGAEYGSLTRLNIYSACAITLYLVVAVIRARLAEAAGTGQFPSKPA